MNLGSSTVRIICIFAVHAGIFPASIADTVSVIVASIIYLCQPPFEQAVLISAESCNATCFPKIRPERYCLREVFNYDVQKQVSNLKFNGNF